MAAKDRRCPKSRSAHNNEWPKCDFGLSFRRRRLTLHHIPIFERCSRYLCIQSAQLSKNTTCTRRSKKRFSVWSGVLNFLLPCSPSSDPSSSIPSCFSHHEVLIMQGMLEWTSTLTQLASKKTGFPNLYGFGGLQVASNCFKKRPLFVERLLSQWLSEAYFIFSQFLLAQIAADKKINLPWDALRTKNYNHQLTRSRRVQKPIIIIDKTAPFEFNSSIILCSKKQRGALSDSHYNSS